MLNHLLYNTNLQTELARYKVNGKNLKDVSRKSKMNGIWVQIRENKILKYFTAYII